MTNKMSISGSIKTALLAGFMAVATPVAAACNWPAWESFKQDYISDQGRVIDPSDPRQITTSEGQSYALFFALVDNDRETFDRLLAWTGNNLAQGDLAAHLPAWLWGHKSDDNSWVVLDSNSASDADMWIAWSLLEAGRLWDEARYRELGEKLLALIAKHEVTKVPGLGAMLLPGQVGFTEKDRWRLNPSYLPPQVLARVASLGEPWNKMAKGNNRLLVETSPKGFSPDWASWQKGKGWLLPAKPPVIGSYDAIRVYLWVGMMSDRDPQKAALLKHFEPMIAALAKDNLPTEKNNVVTGASQGHGPVGFSAALLPMLEESASLAGQRKRVADEFPGKNAYYSYVLTLFGQGWDQQRFRFNLQGELVPDWGRVCANTR